MCFRRTYTCRLKVKTWLQCGNKQEVARYRCTHAGHSIVFICRRIHQRLWVASAKRGVGFALCTAERAVPCAGIRRNKRKCTLRRTQYRTADDMHASCKIARTMIFAKLYNSRWSIERTRRDHGMRVDDTKLAEASQSIKALLPQAISAENMESLRGNRGQRCEYILRRVWRNDTQREGCVLFQFKEQTASA